MPPAIAVTAIIFVSPAAAAAAAHRCCCCCRRPHCRHCCHCRHHHPPPLLLHSLVGCYVVHKGLICVAIVHCCCHRRDCIVPPPHHYCCCHCPWRCPISSTPILLSLSCCLGCLASLASRHPPPACLVMLSVAPLASCCPSSPLLVLSNTCLPSKLSISI